ncbi:hypothetical protein VKT23_000101 [Stygiomarasmius scandens]|uniref:Uncharacterized protein n=1 Tax=Marasmiellus scandens TaxID=2682957 RepID=A0ABR1K8M7_9AGAR
MIRSKVNTSAIEYLQRVLDIINRGREEWKVVPRKAGELYSAGVWNSLLHATLEAFAESESEEQRERLKDLKMHAEIIDNPPNVEELGADRSGV